MTISIKELNYSDSYPTNSPIIVMLHGLGSDSTSWQFQIDALGQAGFRPIAVDIPGFGKSKYPYRRWNVKKAALIIIHNLIDRLDEPINIIGLSMGGTVAQEIYFYRPNRISKMILVSTFARLRPSAKENLPYLSRRVAQIAIGDIRKQAGTVSDRIFPSPQLKEMHDYLYFQIREANPRTYRQAMISLGLFNSTRWMKKCSLPLLVISGSLDSTVTLDNQIKLAKIIPGAKHVIIQDGGHAVSVDHFEQFNKEVIRFLTSD